MPISRSGSVKIAVTLGDAAGIGPEVALKSLAQWLKKPSVKVLLLGNASFYSKLAARLKLKLAFRDISDLREWKNAPSRATACYFPEKIPASIRRGRPDTRLARLAMRSIEEGVKLAMKGGIDALVTPPIHKASVKKAGFNVPGHTEFLAKLSKTKHYEMMLVGGPLRVVLVTRHVAIKDVPRGVSARRVREATALAVSELRRSFGIRRPRIVVCGLNPHAGEEGNFGREEMSVIAPAVRRLKKEIKNAEITGPLSPDALFVDAYRGRYDAEICMYHDQGLIPLKMISRGGGVNVTLGLPFVRTSPDHGTAYDIAARFKADEGSMLEAMKLAAALSKSRKRRA